MALAMASYGGGYGKLPARVRAMDMRHVLLILLVLLNGLLTEDVEEYNRINPLVRIVDPSDSTPHDGGDHYDAFVVVSTLSLQVSRKG